MNRRFSGSNDAPVSCHVACLLLIGSFLLLPVAGLLAESGATTAKNISDNTDGTLRNDRQIRLCELAVSLRTDYGRNSPRALNTIRQMIQLDPDNALNYYLAAAVSAVQQDWVRMTKYLQAGNTHPTGYYYVLGTGVERYLRLETQRRFALVALQNLAWKANEGDLEALHAAREMALKVLTFTPRSGLAFNREWQILSLADDGMIEYYQLKKDLPQELLWTKRRETDRQWAATFKTRIADDRKKWASGGLVTSAAIAQLNTFLSTPLSTQDKTAFDPVADALFQFDRECGDRQRSLPPP